MKVSGWLVLSGLGLAMALAGCSRADPSIIAAAPEPSGGAAGGAVAIDVAADPTALKYQQEALTGAADQPITVNFQNPAQLEHNWVLVQPGQEQAVADAASAAGGDPTGIAGVIAGGVPIANGGEPIQVPPIPAGSYPYICTVPGHYASGMAGTLTLGAAAEGSGAPAASPAAGNEAPPADAAGGQAVDADPSGALKYQQTALQAQGSQPFTVAFNNPAPLQHNWVLVEPGQEQAVADAAAAKAGDATGLPGVIAASPVVNGASSANVEVPAIEPGTYPYICTLPGHYAAGMRGDLTVGP